jgi:hypothetical protein
MQFHICEVNDVESERTIQLRSLLLLDFLMLRLVQPHIHFGLMCRPRLKIDSLSSFPSPARLVLQLVEQRSAQARLRVVRLAFSCCVVLMLVADVRTSNAICEAGF